MIDTTIHQLAEIDCEVLSGLSQIINHLFIRSDGGIGRRYRYKGIVVNSLRSTNTGSSPVLTTIN
jgi:hypothetical protein